MSRKQSLALKIKKQETVEIMNSCARIAQKRKTPRRLFAAFPIDSSVTGNIIF
jgi:hypothetical protein